MSLTVVLVVLVPLLLFGWLIGQAMPTPRDRQLERLRTRARTLQLHVTLRMLPDPDPEPGQRVSSGGVVREPKLEVAAYTLPLRLPRELDKRHAPSWSVARMRQHDEEVYAEGLSAGWRLQRAEVSLQPGILATLSELLARTPRGTVTLEASARDVTLCWRERGGDEEVDAIAALLEDVAAFQTARAREAAGQEARADAQPGQDAPEE